MPCVEYGGLLHIQKLGYLKSLFFIFIIYTFVLCFQGYKTLSENSKFNLEVVQRLNHTIELIYKHLEENKKVQKGRDLFQKDVKGLEFETLPPNSRTETKKIYMDNASEEINFKQLHEIRNVSNISSLKQNLLTYPKRFPDVDQFQRQQISILNCKSLIQGGVPERKSRLLHNISVLRLQLRQDSFQSLSTNCTKFIQDRNYITSSLTKEEEMFPIAYSLMVFKDAFQVEMLLRAIYRPQNFHCIHIDQKSKHSFKEIIRSISSCFDNVFISSRSVNVTWGEFSVLEPELICMKDLLKYKKWKYFINLTGQEFPLRTNGEIVKILKIFNGANDVAGSNTVTKLISLRWAKAGMPPRGIRPIKGGVHIVVNRQFVEYIHNNKTAKDFLEWAKKTRHPDEVYFNSLNNNPQLQIPGSFKGELGLEEHAKPCLTRFKIWASSNFSCHGKWVRTVCVFGVGDLPQLSKRPELFANKFHLNYQPLVRDCLEELIYNRTRDEYLLKSDFNTSFYEQLSFIQNVIK